MMLDIDSEDQLAYDIHPDACWRCDSLPASTDVGLCDGCHLDLTVPSPRRGRARARVEVGLDLASLTWVCHVCHDDRPDAAISVHKATHHAASGLEFQVNVRYCNDRPECIGGAPSVAASWAAVLV